MQTDSICATATERTLRFAFASACGGRILVLMSDRGVVDVCSADSEFDLLHQARLRFPGATLVPDRGSHAAWVASVEHRFHHGIAAGVSRPPLDLGGERCA